MHIQYPKILAIHKEECEWILDWYVYVQEKIDGCNLSVWYNNWICILSRTQIIYEWWESKKEFRWAQDVILQHEWIKKLLEENPTYRLFWEYLVRHTIVYPEEYYNKFYLFDILVDWEFFETKYVYELADKYWIDTPQLLYEWEWDIERIRSLVWKSSMWVVWEWVVIKNHNFVNKFLRKQYAKIVRDEFKEANSIVFWNYNKWDIEMEFAIKFITEARVLKIVNKIEQNEDRKIQIQDTPMVMWLVYNDAFTEEIWWFHKNKTIDFKELKNKCDKRTRFLFHSFLENA